MALQLVVPPSMTPFGTFECEQLGLARATGARLQYLCALRFASSHYQGAFSHRRLDFRMVSNLTVRKSAPRGACRYAAMAPCTLRADLSTESRAPDLEDFCALPDFVELEGVYEVRGLSAASPICSLHIAVSMWIAVGGWGRRCGRRRGAP